MKDIITVGEILIDLTQCGTHDNGIPLFSANPGGAPANVAVAASLLGADTAFIGKVGNDSYGNFLKNTLENKNVDISALVTDDNANTTLAVVSVAESGERSFSFYRKNCADTLLNELEISTDFIRNTHIIHFGSVSLTDEPSRSAVISAVKRAKSSGVTVTYDPNYRKSLWSSEKEAINEIKSAIGLADILKISDEELLLITGTDNLESGTKLLYDAYGTKLIFVTLGAKGAFFRQGTVTGSCGGIKVNVADTNGAGDTFFGAVLSRIVSLNKYDPAKLCKKELEEITGFANAAAAITTSRHGAIPAMPDLSEVKQKHEGGCK